MFKRFSEEFDIFTKCCLTCLAWLADTPKLLPIAVISLLTSNINFLTNVKIPINIPIGPALPTNLPANFPIPFIDIRTPPFAILAARADLAIPPIDLEAFVHPIFPKPALKLVKALDIREVPFLDISTALNIPLLAVFALFFNIPICCCICFFSELESLVLSSASFFSSIPAALKNSACCFGSVAFFAFS